MTIKQAKRYEDADLLEENKAAIRAALKKHGLNANFVPKLGLNDAITRIDVVAVRRRCNDRFQRYLGELTKLSEMPMSDFDALVVSKLIKAQQGGGENGG